MQFVYVCLKQIAGICNSQGQLEKSRQPEPWEIYGVKQTIDQCDHIILDLQRQEPAISDMSYCKGKYQSFP